MHPVHTRLLGEKCGLRSIRLLAQGAGGLAALVQRRACRVELAFGNQRRGACADRGEFRSVVAEPFEIGAEAKQFVGGLGEAVRDFGFRDLRLAEPLQDFAQGRLCNAFGRGGSPHQQNISDVRSDLDRELRPALEFRHSAVCVQRVLPRLEQSQLVRITLDIFRQDRNVVVAQIDEAGLLKPNSLLVFGLRIRNSHARRQAAIFEPNDDDEEVALANLIQADVDRPPGPRAKELHRIVSALDPPNGVENAFALLLEVVKGAADEHSERIGHRVFPMTYRANRCSLFRASLSVLRDAPPALLRTGLAANTPKDKL